MSIKCPQCGLVNFADATECKRCHFEFIAAAPDLLPASDEKPLAETNEAQPLLVQTSARPSQNAKPFEPLPVFEPVATPVGGWLILFAIMLLASLGLAVYILQKDIGFYNMKEYQFLTTEGHSFYISGLSSFMMTELIWNGIVVVSVVMMLFRLFRRSSSFPRIAIIMLSLGIVAQIVNYFMALTVRDQFMKKFAVVFGRGNVPEILPSYLGYFILLAIVISLLWIFYFLTSRRVETTFVY